MNSTGTPLKSESWTIWAKPENRFLEFGVVAVDEDQDVPVGRLARRDRRADALHKGLVRHEVAVGRDEDALRIALAPAGPFDFAGLVDGRDGD